MSQKGQKQPPKTTPASTVRPQATNGNAKTPPSANSTRAGSFSAADLNRIVLEYLNKKGYHRTEQMLRVESSRTLTPQNKQSPGNPATGSFPEPGQEPSYQGTRPVSNPVNVKRDSDGNLISQQANSSPRHYFLAYSMLKNWVDSSLDMYKPELTRIIYPIFIYVFLTLVAKNAIQARRFFDKFSVDYKAFHASEINKLFSVNSIDHIKENELAQGFQSNKYRVTISRTTLNLLLYFLNENESIGGSLLISIINQNLDPNIVETITSQETLTDGIKDVSAGAVDVETHNSVPVKLGKFPVDEEFAKEVETELQRKDDQAKSQDEESNQKGLIEEYRELNKFAKDEKSTNDDDKTEPGTMLVDSDKKDDRKQDLFMESPSRDILPLPSKTALDLKLEIQKVRESRDAMRLENLQSSAPSVCMYTFHNTNSEMTSLEFSDDVRLASAGFQDSIIKIWSLDGTPLQNKLPSKQGDRANNATLVGHSGTVYSTSFSPDNRYLISASEDKTVRLWSTDTFTSLVSYKGHNHPIWDVAFSPLGHYFATASHDQTARLWSCDHIYPLRIFAGHLNDVDTVSFHPNGTYVFTGSSDKTCRMWDMSTGDSVRLFLGHTAPVTSTAVSPDGRWLSTGSEDGIINVWDIGTGKRLKQMRGHGKNAIYSLSYSKEGNVLMSGGADQSVRVWDAKKSSAEPGAEPEQPFTSYSGDVTTSVNQDIKEYGRRRTIVPTSDLLASFYTKKTPVYKVKFTRSNLVLAGGAFRE
ncbi:LANO_0E08856g1_1 [Lachancea nothofagi CBS 11611]|uniref:LANO_0E08856g1_1 n=1 Tax=Lachancea nothofagi CBS 11611 TaxID=1266666 RepID=A0A1G4JVC9_9SACH|nr:LANO_0E08856g1_1 [Lachancea nothofagi CBS 11611]